MYVRPCSPTYDVVFQPLTRSLKVVLHGEPPKGKAFTIEWIQMFTLVEHMGVHKIKAVNKQRTAINYSTGSSFTVARTSSAATSERGSIEHLNGSGYLQ
jgi:hypothetical protein